MLREFIGILIMSCLIALLSTTVVFAHEEGCEDHETANPLNVITDPINEQIKFLITDDSEEDFELILDMKEGQEIILKYE
jgi:hypothetical protein